MVVDCSLRHFITKRERKMGQVRQSQGKAAVMSQNPPTLGTADYYIFRNSMSIVLQLA